MAKLMEVMNLLRAAGYFKVALSDWRRRQCHESHLLLKIEPICCAGW